MPLVVMLHGCGQDAVDFGRVTGMNALAKEHGKGKPVSFLKLTAKPVYKGLCCPGAPDERTSRRSS
jgi:hypothetical protein